MNKKPKIRFNGFIDDWEQRKFSDVVQIARGGSPRPINDFITDSPNGLNWVKIGDAPLKGHYIRKTAEKIRPEGISKTREVHPGDLILSNSMSFGKPYIMGINGCIHDGWLLIRNTNNIFNLNFLCHLLETPQMLDQYRALAAGSTVNNLNKELVGKTVVTIPNIEEQQYLGQYLEQFDSLIALHQRKLETLKIMKKSCLEKMFPKKEKVIPDIRFNGFTNSWEQRKFGECCDLLTGYPFNSKNFSESGILLIRGMNVKRNYIDISSENCKYWNTTIGLEKYLLQENDILIQMDGALIGKSYSKISKECLPALLVQRVTRARMNNENYDIEFLYECVQREFLNYVIGIKTETAVPHLSLNDIRNFNISITNISEQKLISKYFKNIDDLIILHQRELEKLYNMKKSLLENMFA